MVSVQQSNQHAQSALPIRILDHLSISISFSEANEIATSVNGRLPTFSEFIIALKDQTFYNQSIRKSFWLCDEPRPRTAGNYRIDYEKGIIEELQTRLFETPQEQRAHIFSGDGHLLIYVLSESADWRLNVYSHTKFSLSDHVVIVSTAEALERGRAALARLKRGLQE